MIPNIVKVIIELTSIKEILVICKFGSSHKVNILSSTLKAGIINTETNTIKYNIRSKIRKPVFLFRLHNDFFSEL